MAKRFRFRLETLLAMRKRREDEQRRVVADSLRELGQCQQAWIALHSRATEAFRQARAQRARRSLDVHGALRDQLWRAHLKRRIDHQQEEIRRVERQLEVQRRELARRATERKALEILRDRQWAEHRAAQARAERIEEDEIAARKRPGEAIALTG